MGQNYIGMLSMKIFLYIEVQVYMVYAEEDKLTKNEWKLKKNIFKMLPA